MSVVNAETGVKLDAQASAQYRTIDGLFDFVGEAIDYPVAGINVAFDSSLGTHWQGTWTTSPKSSTKRCPSVPRGFTTDPATCGRQAPPPGSQSRLALRLSDLPHDLAGGAAVLSRVPYFARSLAILGVMVARQ